MVRPSSAAFFQGRPLLVLPGGNGLLIALRCPLDRLLPAQAYGPQEAADMRRMIADAKGSPDDLGYPFGRPNLAAIAVGFGPWCSQARQLLHLLCRQCGGPALGWAVSQHPHGRASAIG